MSSTELIQDQSVPKDGARGRDADSTSDPSPKSNSVANRQTAAGSVPFPLVRSQLDSFEIGEPWLVVDSDVDLDGRDHQEWLAVDDDRVTVVATPGGDAASASLLVQFKWSQLQAARTTGGVGSGLLQVQVDNRWIDLLRYSNTHAHRFHKVSRRLDARAKGERLLEDPTAVPLDPPRCPSCHLKLSDNGDSCPRCLQRGRILTRVWGLLKPHWRGAITLCLLTVLGVGAELIPPKLQQYMVDHLLMNRTTGGFSGDIRTALLVVVLALAASRIVLSAVGVVKGRLATVIGSSLTCQLRTEMVQKLQQLAIAYYDRHQVGSMISRVAHDSEVLHGLMHQLTGGFLLQTVQLFGVGAMLIWLNPKLALFTLIPVPLVFIGSWVYWRIVYPRYFRLWDASSKQMTVLNGMLSGIRVVKAFAQEDREFDRFRTASERLRDWRLWVDYTSSRYAASMQLVFSLGGLIVWYVGGRDVIGEEMTLGQLIAFLAYLSMFYAPLGALSNFTTWLTSFLSGSKRVLELLDTPVSVMDADEPEDWDDPKGAINFDQVTFGYEPNQPVLKDISFEVEPGEMIGIVGRSGSGKTTMVNLLGRFYDVQEGSITVDGIDVRKLSVNQLREHLGIVFQESFLFRGTIWDNLAYGRPATTIEEGLSSAKAAGAHDFICRTQLGYETQLGERGSGLSGGEKQRLSIARTLLYDPKVLVLDEATSNIDAESEKSIQEALEVLIKGRTTIAIAHRLSTLRNADRILVFDRGRLVEQGSHAKLIADDGVYARLVRIQTSVSKDPNVDRLISRLESGKPSAEQDETDTLDDRSEASEATPAIEASTNSAPSELAKNHEAKINWLDSASDRFHVDDNGQIFLQRTNGSTQSDPVFVVCTFPATHPEAFLSVRTWNEDGDDREMGLIRDLKDWPDKSQLAVRKSLRRRYLLRRIVRFNSLQLVAGFLECDVECDTGPARFTMRWTQSKAIDFSENGKLIIDVDDNRYIVEDVDALPKRDQEKFLHYVYW